MDHGRRIKALQRAVARKGLDALVVTDMSDVRYLCGFTGSSGALLALKDRMLFITDFRYKTQAAEESGAVAEVIISPQSPIVEIPALMRKCGAKRLGFDPRMPYSYYETLAASKVALTAARDMVPALRAAKDAEETALIRDAVRRAEAAYVKISPRIRPGVTERSIALRLEEAVKREGAARIPFDIIAASGPNSAKPHAGATERKLRPGDLFTLDWGAEAGGYFSDMTRTVILRGASGDMALKRRIHALVLKANRAGVAAVRAGARAADVDKAARDVINKAGHAEHFGHGTGHGVGLDVHEKPRVSTKSKERLRAGMIITVEPGIYIPGAGGVRIEDLVAVEARGAEVMTSLPRGPEAAVNKTEVRS